MDLKELITFQTILRQGTFSKAAESLHYAQSTITNQIQRLEKELGISLFYRGWEAELTPAGKIFAEEVDDLINHWKFVTEQAKAIQKEEVGTINIGIIDSITNIVPSILARFSREKPKIVCNFVVGNTNSLAAALEKNEIDFAICAEIAGQFPYTFESLYEEKLAFIVSNIHPFANKSRMYSLEELCDYPIVTGGKNCIYQLKLEKELLTISKKPFCYTISQLSIIPQFIISIDGAIGVIVSSMPIPDNCKKLDVEINNSDIKIGIMRNLRYDNMTSSKQLLLNYLIESLSRVK
ncbi:transcriptional regulator [Niallia circulans]|jgi:LysR family transcriptional regulator, regulator of the ytmI operon|uniref:Transcriptional regulator n=1 Tax=Niallia circulans TaxID=1397 RepID=A0A0J1LAB8_NIACI|nr:LysR family transcriptional regulator [Niallia circulans]AYV69740.1 LysR family transcriptional regulator [Niallia circulans]AYV71864.1 LysR family transcriptional regulator [Niallia circulans]KLV25845.1 transcriptional regulator [Niallia circulans]MED5103351.1 LysR family transcriptional regulator [Niallia circulans]NRG28316.1 LysR family transcriptional regulator [Niallia circulans]